MMVMTAKVQMKKLLMILGGIAVGILLLILLLSAGKDSAQTAAPVSDNDSRVQFLAQQGWQVSASPVQSGQVIIPQEGSQVYDRYNALQKSQGYDLSRYAGKTVMRYVYQVKSTQSQEPVYATVLVYRNEIIGGDITDTAPQGSIQGLKKPDTAPE